MYKMSMLLCSKWATHLLNTFILVTCKACSFIYHLLECFRVNVALWIVDLMIPSSWRAAQTAYLTWLYNQIFGFRSTPGVVTQKGNSYLLMVTWISSKTPGFPVVTLLSRLSRVSLYHVGIHTSCVLDATGSMWSSGQVAGRFCCRLENLLLICSGQISVLPINWSEDTQMLSRSDSRIQEGSLLVLCTTCLPLRGNSLPCPWHWSSPSQPHLPGT